MIHSFEDDSLFTEDVLDNVCKFELAVQKKASDYLGKTNQRNRSNSGLASLGENSLNIIPPINKGDCFSTQSVNVLKQEELEYKENKHIIPRFSKRILNKTKLQNISKTLNNSSSLQKTVQEISVLKTCDLYNTFKDNDSSRLKKNIISSTSTPKTCNNEQKNDAKFCELRNNISCNRQSILTNDISSISFESTVIEDDEKEKVDGSIDVSSSLSSQDKLDLSCWGLPEDVLNKYKENGISFMFPWQVECLSLPGVLDGCNLVYSAPTSAGKTLVAEIILLKRVLEQKKKGVFILPYVSIAREKTYSLQRLFGVAGVRVEGFMGGQSPPGGFQKTDIAICTIEKANNIINKLIEDQKLGDLGVIVVDELHMVGDPHRGYLLELLLTKLQYVATLKKEELHIQVIGMSATLPNLHVLAQWQKGKYYSTTYRPIPLLQMVKIGSTLYNEDFTVIRDLHSSEIKIKDDGEHLIQLCLETVLEGYSVLIFCPAKAWCEKISLNIASSLYSIGKNNSGYPENIVQALRNRLNEKDLSRVLEALRACPAGLDSVLERSLSFGAAFHHAGLTFDERDIIEGAFRAGYVPILVATSTLSSGVNLPARRVIIRSPNAGGQLMDPLVYKQMVGRAGRKGKDTMGESILLCGPNEKFKAEKLVTAMLPPVASCLQRNSSLSTSLKRAILEIVVSGAAKSVDDITRYWYCTLLAATTRDKNQNGEDEKSKSMPLVEECIQYLLDNELARFQEVDSKSNLVGTQLGSAILASGLSPDEGLHVFSELQRARECFVLENELHVVYQVTPIYVSDSWPNLDWLRFLEIWETLSEGMKKVGQLVGIQENFLVRAMKGTVNYKIAKHRSMLAIHQRFYACLALHDLVHEVSLKTVVAKYGATKGLLQALQQSAATFAGMVTVFCNRLGWHNLELLIAQYQNRLQFGVQRDLCDLVKLSLLNGFRARLLFDSGHQSVNHIAHSKPEEIASILSNAGPFKSCKGLISSEGFILGPDGTPLSITEAAKSIVHEARNLVQKELGLNVIEWGNKNSGLTCARFDETHSSHSDSSIIEESEKHEPAVNNNKKRLNSESSSERSCAKSPKLSQDEDVKGKIVPLSDCKVAIKPADIRKELNCSMEKNLKYESGYASKGSVGSINLNDSDCKTPKKTEVENLLEPKIEKFELSLVSKAKPKGSFLFSKSSTSSLQMSSGSKLASEVLPDTLGKVTKENASMDVKITSTREDISNSNNDPSTKSKEKELENVDGRKSTLLSESMKAAFLNTLNDDDFSFMSKVEKSNRDSTQSEDFFNIHSDDEEEKTEKEEVPFISNKNLQTPVYSACSEKIDFGFDLSKTGQGLSRKCKSIRNLDDSLVFSNDVCNLNFDDINNVSDEASILMTESGVLSLTRENIEKDLNDFDSSLINCDNLMNNLEDSKTDLFLDNDYGSDSHNKSDNLNIALNNTFSSSNANLSCNRLSVSSNFSTLMLTPGTEEILDKVTSPQKIETEKKYNKEENLENEDCITDISSQSNSFVSQQTRSLSIIDVASDEKLFQVFIKEWKSQNKFSLSIMCEKIPDRQDKCRIGWRISGRSRRTPRKNDVSGIIIERTQLLLTGIAVCWGSLDSYFINLKTFKEDSSSKEPGKDKSYLTPPASRAVSLEKRIDAIRTVLCNGTIEKTLKMWNAKETLKYLHGSGIAVSKFLFHDPRVAFWLLDPTAKQKSLQSMVVTYCEGYSHLLENIGVFVGTGSVGISCSEEERKGESLRIKACTESVLVYHLTEAFKIKLSSAELLQVWESVEMPSLFNFTLMELNGMGFSVKECNDQKRKMQEKLDLLEAEAFKIIGRPFSISSPIEVSKIIYTELNLESPCKQPRSSLRQVPLRKKRIVQGPTNKEALQKLKDKHPLPGIILEWRRINSALTKVVYPLSQEMVSCVALGEERIFPVCHTFTATGRVAFHEPNVQNIPKDFLIELPDKESNKEINAKPAKTDFTPVMCQLAPLLDPVQCSTTYTVSLRHSIVAGKNRILLAADYSQLELRILAHLSCDRHLLRVLNEGQDVFKNIASQIYSIEVDEVTDNMRQESKQICYGIIYGMSDKTLAEQLDITEEEANNFMKQFHEKFPSIIKFIQDTVKEARKNGYVVTLEGRKRFLPEINSTSIAAKGQSERQAVNTCIQGSAADIVKKALISIQESLIENFPQAPLTLTQRLKGEETLCGGYLILQLHDELIYEVANDDVIQVAQIVKESMENVVSLSVCLPVKLKVGPTWGTVQTLNL